MIGGSNAASHARAPLLVALLVLLPLSMRPALAAGGHLDTSFGGDGTVTDSRINGATIAIQSSGKIVAGGIVPDDVGEPHFGLLRYRANGNPDAAFGGAGAVITDFRNCPGGFEWPNAVLIQGDDKVVAVGLSYCKRSRFAIARYDADGTPDPSFGGDGKVMTSFGDPLHCSAYAEAAALQTDGKIIAAGEMHCEGVSARFAVARYNADGTLDPSFGIDGEVRTNFTSGYDYASGVAVQSNGKIIVAGPAAYVGEERFALARYRADGTLDPEFGDNGKVKTSFPPLCGGAAIPAAVAIQPDGKIVAAGIVDCAVDVNGLVYSGFGLARYHRNGRLDTTFGGDGRVISTFRNCGASAHDLAIQANGKILAAGDVSCTKGFDVARYRRHGRLDTTWDGDGLVTTAFGTEGCAGALADDVIIQADRKIVAAGLPSCPSGAYFGMARYLPA